MSSHRSLKFAMSLGKKDLLEKIKEEEDLVQLLQEHGCCCSIFDSCYTLELAISNLVVEFFKSWMSKFSFYKLIAWILIVFYCGLFSVVLVIGKCKFISTIHSITRVKDGATTLWRQHSPSYDNNRAVQIPSPEPGHTVRRKRKS
jgi:hypothetical protein